MAANVYSLIKISVLLCMIVVYECRTLRGRIDHSRFTGTKIRKLENEDRHDSSRKIEDEEIVYPMGELEPIPPAASDCDNQTFCENVPNYPDELVSAILDKHKDFKNYQQLDEVPEAASRFNIPPEDIALCQFREKVIYPKIAKNVDKKWLYVVNREDFAQGIRVEMCLNEDEECDIVSGVVSLGYRSKCKQRYVYRQLMVVAPGGKVKPEFFRFPSSCCCHIEHQDPFTRWRR